MLKKNAIVVFFSIVVSLGMYAQRSSHELTFTAIDSTSHVRLDSIRVMNRTQGSETSIYWPDTALTVIIDPGDLLLYIGYSTCSPAGTGEINTGKRPFQLSQNHPNPLKDQSMIPLYVPSKGVVDMTVSDVLGRVLLNSSFMLGEGHHAFRFTPGDGMLFFLIAHYEGETSTITMLATEGKNGRKCMLEYAGSSEPEFPQKAPEKTTADFIRASGIPDHPLGDKTYTFQFATNIPCPGTPTVEYEGQVYNTIQIYSQCWLKENLNVGVMIPGSDEMGENGVFEKYCYDDDENNCDVYGGLYQWGEMMQYTSQEGTQGICPPGWHLPLDEDWKVLEGAVDSNYGIGDPEWDVFESWRGFDAGILLKSTNGWAYSGNGSDLFGFVALPGGFRQNNGNFEEVTLSGAWWSSMTAGGYGWYHFLSYGSSKVWWHHTYWDYGMSVRCLRDQPE